MEESIWRGQSKFVSCACILGAKINNAITKTSTTVMAFFMHIEILPRNTLPRLIRVKPTRFPNRLARIDVAVVF
jgi:hypothetical protein